jgi:glutathione S-transferase
MTARRPRLAADLAIAAPQTLSLLDGENLSPAYLKVQPTGTVPALDSTIKVVKYLVANAPRKPESWEPATPEIVEAFHACVVLRRLAHYRSPY